MRILITGGAGYIGSHMVDQLLREGHHVAVVDNLSTGKKWAVPEEVPFFKEDVSEQGKMKEILSAQKIEAVIHFAASTSVPESVSHPEVYFNNNFVGTMRLVDACIDSGINKFIFSSTAAVYGEPDVIPVDEGQSKRPVNPYGESKWAAENYLKWISQKTDADFSYVALRYFNVAGASMRKALGQASEGSMHLIKVACEHAVGLRDKICLFGTDYETPDGTCVRDYIHVEDLVAAHTLSLNYLADGGESDIFNCGYGRGYSVRQVLNSLQGLCEQPLNIVETERRAGDPARLVADAAKIKSKLGWEPQFADIDTICKSALSWEKTWLEMRKTL